MNRLRKWYNTHVVNNMPVNVEIEAPKPLDKSKKEVILYSVISICPGFRHAWFMSSVGKIRKEIHHIENVIKRDTKLPAIKR